MAKLQPKAVVKPFASEETNPNFEPTPVGQWAGGGAVTPSLDPEVLLENASQGITKMTVQSGTSTIILPPASDIAGLYYSFTYFLKALQQTGIAEYSAVQDYHLNDITKAPSGSKIYRSLINNNIGNPLTDITKWEELDLLALKQATTSQRGTLQIATTSDINAGTDNTKALTIANLRASNINFTGTPTAPTQATTDNSTKLATTQYVNTLVKANKGKLNSQTVRTADFTITPAMAGTQIYINAGTCETITFPQPATDFAVGDLIFIQNGGSPAGISLKRSTGEDIIINDFGNKLPAGWSVAIGTNGGTFWDVVIPPNNTRGDFRLPASPSVSDNSTKIATTQHVKQNLVNYAPLNSPALINPTANTPATSDNSTKIATTEYVNNKIASEKKFGIDLAGKINIGFNLDFTAPSNGTIRVYWRNSPGSSTTILVNGQTFGVEDSPAGQPTNIIASYTFPVAKNQIIRFNTIGSVVQNASFFAPYLI